MVRLGRRALLRAWQPGRPRQPAHGFTLIEVMVALAVLAVALSALIQAGAQRADNVGYLRDRTFASWIASDRLAEIRLEQDWPSPGTSDGKEEMAGRTWHWRAEVEETEEGRVRRVTLAVRADPDAEPLARVTGFVGHPEDQVTTPGGQQ